MKLADQYAAAAQAAMEALKASDYKKAQEYSDIMARIFAEMLAEWGRA